jgi:Na+-transporting NADH:ubiquinone oxidoreductase, subunit NqrF
MFDLHALLEFFSAVDPKLMLFAIVAFILIGVGLAAMILYTKNRLDTGEECTIEVNDDPTMTIHIPEGTTLLSALTSNGVPIPSPCGGKATCKQCRVQITGEAPDPMETDRATFNKKQLKEGWRLSCQCKVKSSIHVHVEEHILGTKEWYATVVSNNNVATFIKELVVELPEGEAVPYKSGGYLQFHVPPFKTNTEDWKATMEPQYWPDWEKYKMFGKEIDFSYLGGKISAPTQWPRILRKAAN